MKSSSPYTPLPRGEGDSTIAPALPTRQKARWEIRSALRLFAVYLALAILLYFALRNVPLGEIWNTIRGLQLWQVMTLFGLNTFIYGLITLRWWVIVRAGNKHIPYFPLLLVRIAVFGVSYFTLGPHVGGEPLQVFYLQRKYKLSFTHATASVIMDKLLELLANFVLLAVGLTAVLQAGILSTSGSVSWLSLGGLVILCMWPLVHILFLYQRKYPFSTLLRSLPFLKKDSKPVRFIAASERLAGTFCRRHMSSLISAAAISVLGGVGMMSEFALIVKFLGIQLSSWQTIAAWTAGWLSLLAPLPGGLGALEASQVFALGMFGVPAALAIGVALVMRGRDLLIGGLGLFLASRALEKQK
ncbi:MAG TPA: lysylphosphatidylglycerol synthase transmembrane domain-containing protein [Anaerolineales bacterium]|nr:lysylphosphatidylglycerol synthase transmembrane domain-containing protein [Anaerolineales bacterium]